ncbi:MAG: hypothetical protein J7J10_00290 [Deltaproteobacteria bacterium]|nr:hypothetical protein [Deltaproteobacteria bacterium]
MWDILREAFTSTAGSFITIILIAAFIVIFVSWLVLPFILWNIKSELKNIKNALEKKTKEKDN